MNVQENQANVEALAARIVDALLFPANTDQSMADHIAMGDRQFQLHNSGGSKGIVRQAALEFIASVLRGEL